MSRGATLTLLGLLPPLAGAACGLAFQRPSVAVAEVRLAALGLSGGTVEIRLQVDNPNGYEIQAEDLSYALAFSDGEGDAPEWLTLSTGTVAETLRVPARGTGYVDVALPFEFATVGRALGSLLRHGELEYRFSGELRVRTRIGGARVPFDERGVFRP